MKKRLDKQIYFIKIYLTKSFWFWISNLKKKHMKLTLKEILINNDINPLIIDDFTDFLLELKGQNFAQFTNMIGDYFWTIANDCHIITEPDHADDYYEENMENFLQIANFDWIKEFWGVENLADLPSVKVANYFFSTIEENKINKINKILFDIINQ